MWLVLKLFWHFEKLQTDGVFRLLNVWGKPIKWRTPILKLCTNPDVVVLRHLPYLYLSDNFVGSWQKREIGEKSMACDRATLGWWWDKKPNKKIGEPFGTDSSWSQVEVSGAVRVEGERSRAQIKSEMSWRKELLVQDGT